ncbi:MAG TPA: SLC13 family permease [Galbitalea sp.]|jgi:Na+/H+ antiporter NhaD/arsenite permease-like protein|nr:SLC13 family permease [Galbitalea sp.]
MRTALLGVVLVALGVIAIATGLLPVADAVALGQRVWPILLFVVAITVLTELAAAAGLFAVVAERLARWGVHRAVVLWLLVVSLATVSTIFLSLDTTAVLLTPVVVAVARHVGLPPLPFAMTTVWLANSASLLLPVSNLTNLLAADQLGGGGTPWQFAALMVAPALVAIVVPVAVLFVVYRRQLLVRYGSAEPGPRGDRVLLIASAVVVVLVLPALVSGIAVWIPAVVGAAVLVGFFAVRCRAALRFRLLPWQLVILAAGLFLVVATASGLGLAVLLRTVAGDGTGFLSLLRVAGTGVVASNAVNNLPAYLALEPTAGSPLRLAALLVGVNAGPLITPWASLATLLWRQRLDGLGVVVSWRRYVALGLLAVPLTVVGAVGALALLG